MSDPSANRRLAAIVAADIVTSSRPTGLDEAGILATWELHRRELIDVKIAEYGGASRGSPAASSWQSFQVS